MRVLTFNIVRSAPSRCELPHAARIGGYSSAQWSGASRSRSARSGAARSVQRSPAPDGSGRFRRAFDSDHSACPAAAVTARSRSGAAAWHGRKTRRVPLLQSARPGQCSWQTGMRIFDARSPSSRGCGRSIAYQPTDATI